jgi:HPt (histidine-containing phosphotransfer) domain-containing protein
MPRMDGFEATAEIRAGEKSSGRHLPIAALTARALKGDREACFAAGMDEYLAKPIRVPALRDVMERLTSGSARPAVASLPPAPAPFDAADVLARVEGDRDLLAELVAIFRAEYPALLDTLRRCVESGDARGVEDAAHAIKGTVGNFGAREACEAAARLEAMGQQESLADAGAGLIRLEHTVGALERDLMGMMGTVRS